RAEKPVNEAKPSHGRNPMWRRLLLALALCSCFVNILRPAGCQTVQANQSTLTVFFRVTNGRLAVDRVKSRGAFAATAEFKANLALDSKTAPSTSSVESILFDDLDWAFKQAPQLYWYTLTANELNTQTGEPNDPSQFAAIAHQSDSWEKYSAAFNQ